MDTASLSRNLAAEGAAQQTAAPSEPHLPKGKILTTAQAHPTPMLTDPLPAAPALTENDRRLHAASLRTELGGVGGVVDVIV